MLNTDFDYDALMFFDDTFILNYDRVLEICKCLKQRGIIWRCFVRADLVVKHGNKLLEVMKDSGCVEVGMGIESGSDTILKNINKGESVIIWPRHIEQKDINDMVLSGYDIMSVLKSNIYSNLEAKIKFNNWKKV